MHLTVLLRFGIFRLLFEFYFNVNFAVALAKKKNTIKENFLRRLSCKLDAQKATAKQKERGVEREIEREGEMYNKQMIYSINNEMVIVAVELFAKESEETHDQKKQV